MKYQKIVCMAYKSANEAVQQRALDMAEEKELSYGEALGRVLGEDVQLMTRLDREVLGDDGANALPFSEGEGEGGGEKPPMTPLEAGTALNVLIRKYQAEHPDVDYYSAQKHVFESHPKLKAVYASI